jgi:hypothetical protein
MVEDSPIAYDKVAATIARMRTESLDYLKNALNLA